MISNTLSPSSRCSWKPQKSHKNSLKTLKINTTSYSEKRKLPKRRKSRKHKERSKSKNLNFSSLRMFLKMLWPRSCLTWTPTHSSSSPQPPRSSISSVTLRPKVTISSQSAQISSLWKTPNSLLSVSSNLSVNMFFKDLWNSGQTPVMQF